MSTPALDARQPSLDDTPARQHTPARPPPSRSPSGGPLASTSTSQRSMTSGSTSGGPSTAASHLTLEAALAGANGSHAAALDTVLAERNMLSSQNAQLWKLIEKQRASYANAMKDLERVRGERDKAIARLDGSRGPRRQHSTPQKSSSSSAIPSMSQDSPARESTSTHTTPRASADPPATNGAPAQQADSTRSSPNLDDTSSVVAYSIAEQPEPESATPAVKQPPSIVTTFPTTPARHPASADAVSPTPVNTADPTRPLHIATKKHSLDSHVGSSTSGSPSTQPQISASNMLMPFNDSKRAKRESRISIPPEARNYIQHMDDLPSPSRSTSNLSNVSSSSVNISTSSLNGYGKESLSPVAENPRQRAASSPERPYPLNGNRSQSTTPPFLDMDNSEDEDDAVPSAPTATAPVPIGQVPKAPIYATSSTTSPEPAPSFTYSDDTRGPSTSTSTSPADDFAPNRSQQSFAQQQQTAGPRQQQFDLSTPPNSPPVQTSVSSSSTRAGMFRAQRLIHSDLAQTNIRIAGSNIRPNDRGKEVLSFVIAIAPGNKERYKIEKLYSDVLALDARVRALMSRSQTKALAPLPDPKLFKDHAPAKVDARKSALEKYLQALIRAPMKNTDDLCAFLSSDVVRDAKAPVMQSGHKEGYLTKRGKNFGGWKTRFFVLQNSTLEYYESRGGTHLGSIVITGAQIGRQQRPQQSRADDDDNEFRHAFLIIEAKRGPGGQSPRHVLCAESDAERDAWVEVLVRYVTGAYDESSTGGQSASLPNAAVPRSSTSSYDSSSIKRPRMSKDEISKGQAVPIAQLQIDQHNQKLFQSAPPISDAGSPVGTSPDKSPAHAQSQDSLARKMLERSGHPHNGSEISLSNSVPSYLDVAGHPSQRPHQHQGALTPRSASELGHYPDMKGAPPQGYGAQYQNIERPSSQPSRTTQAQRASYHPSLGTVHSSPTSEHPTKGERAVSPDLLTPRAEQSRPEPPRQPAAPAPEQPRTTKISGPMNGKPIPAGYNFGGSLNQVPPAASASAPAPAPASESLAPPSDRKGKVASRFWQFGRGDKNPVAAPVPTQMARAVFGVALEDSLAVAQIAKLPAIVFRCIQYLEAKRADQEEGIYRLSGSSAVIKSLRDRFNAEGDVDLLASDEFWDPHAIAGLLKSFLRDLPASILTRDLHLRFLHVIDLMDPQERVSELQSLISQLPLANYSLLRALTAHLILIVQNSNVNKMTMRNVGIVFSPTLGIPAGVFSLMLGEFNRVFSVEPDQRPEEVEENPEDPAAAAASQLSRRNSRHYADAAADQLLGLTGRSLGADADESDDGDELLSVHEESGAETENEADVTLTIESHSSTGDAESYHTHQSHHSHQHQHGPPQVYVEQHQGHARPSEHAAGGRAQKAANVAASRGLQVNVAGARVSNMPGLPTSPRPRGPVTPTTASNPATPR